MSCRPNSKGWEFLNDIIIAVAFVIACIPFTAYANGAIGHPGITGTDLIVEATAPFTNFIVDEEVILDFRTFRSNVTYIVSDRKPFI